ncbi:hypothetical protein LHFGNBLO_004067 [Mesorhizobium sp. AR10]|uniref:hypothetical protein n=1 Tax=Mesorhizobium sp. AR10 TaxID=2865839 RepID=UPI00215DDB9E|nr:hypothetical protein [Mesorhizobium sp. AR10]UVK37073.1 hypothetical protein LHFGNBLO_004067 [Mesorhizobium sp. AR10]
MNFIALEAAKGSCLTSSQTIATSVTNPFMVTAAFTIFFGLEPPFIRILAVAGELAAAYGRNLDFLCSAQYVHVHCTKALGQGRLNPREA